MSKGKRNKKRRGHFERKQRTERSTAAQLSREMLDAMTKEAADKEKLAEAEAARVEALKYPKKAENPYYWGGPNGNVLLHKTGRQVALITDFPSFERMREHRRRMMVMAAFHAGEEPYFHEDTNPKLEVANG